MDPASASGPFLIPTPHDTFYIFSPSRTGRDHCGQLWPCLMLNVPCLMSVLNKYLPWPLAHLTFHYHQHLAHLTFHYSLQSISQNPVKAAGKKCVLPFYIPPMGRVVRRRAISLIPTMLPCLPNDSSREHPASVRLAPSRPERNCFFRHREFQRLGQGVAILHHRYCKIVPMKISSKILDHQMVGTSLLRSSQ